MLRLEQGRRKEIAITLRPKHSKEWNRTFWTISGVVLGFHLLLWLTIQIEPTYDSSSENQPRPSVSLIASLQPAPIAKNRALRNNLLPPPGASPQLPGLANRGVEQFSGYVSSNANLFASIEEDYLLLKNQPSLQSSSVALAGPLATRNILHADLPDDKGKELHLVTYEVRVDNRTGKIFWFQQLDALNCAIAQPQGFGASLKHQFELDYIVEAKPPQTYLKKAECILRTIQLNSISTEPITAGLIEICL